MFVLSLFSIYRNFRLNCKFYEISFKGEITDITYTERNLAEIYINKSTRQYLGTNIIYDIRIEKRDSIFKKNKEFEIYLKKKNKVYNITSERSLPYLMKYCPCLEKN